MKLMYAPQSPFSRKVRMAAIELGFSDDIELVYAEVVPTRKNVDYAAIYNPLRQVPTLVTADGLAIYDSTVICMYLDDLAGGGQLFPNDSTARWRVLSEHSLAQGICDATIAIRYETSVRPAALRWPDWVDDRWDKIFTILDWFEAKPESLADLRVNIAQLALMSGIGYIDFRYTEVDWRDGRPRLSSWFDEFGKREACEATRPFDPSRPG